jgi:hypothetical protein
MPRRLAKPAELPDDDEASAPFRSGADGIRGRLRLSNEGMALPQGGAVCVPPSGSSSFASGAGSAIMTRHCSCPAVSPRIPAACLPVACPSPATTPRIVRCSRHEGIAFGSRRMHSSIFKRYGFAWVTGGFFIVSLIGHWVFGWFAFVNEQQAHGQPIQVSEFVVQLMRDTLENWQSEFLQLLWQVAGLALLLHVGSPQSKEGDDRMEAKLDAILLAVDSKNGDRTIRDIDGRYEGRHTDTVLARRIAEEDERRR